MTAVTSQIVTQLQRSIARAIYGKEEAIQLSLITLLARGHLLIEDVPGVGQDHAGAGARQIVSLQLSAHPIHVRPAAQRRAGRQRLQSGNARV